MNRKKKTLRTLALIVIAIVAVVGIILRFKIEPADYGKVLAKEITRSEKLLDQAVSGNDNGEYSDYVTAEFQTQIDTAKQVADKEDSFYDEEKSAYEQLKNAAKDFKKASNTDSLSANEVGELIDSGRTTEKTITFSKWNKLVWKIDGSKLTKAEAVNLHVDTKGPYYEQMCKTMEKYQMQALILAFYQNGDYPGELTVTADTSLKKGKVYLYSYQEKDGTFVYEKDLKSDGETVTFALKKPGTYAILGDTYENYVAAGEVDAEDLATEIVAEETETLTESETETESTEADTEDTGTETETAEANAADGVQTDVASADGNAADTDTAKSDVSGGHKKKDTAGNSNKKNDTKNNTSDQNKNPAKPSTEKPSTVKPQTPTKPSTEKPSITKPSTEKPSIEKPSTEKPSTEKPQTPTEDDGMIECTIQILCTTLSSDLSKLTNQSVRDYVPANGVILDTTTLQIPEGESVYYALRTATRNHNIQMDAEYTPLYSGNYVKGIGYLYEFDAGGESGWMYKVNGQFPNYGCSAYTVQDGDEIVWMYTCDLGRDVGDNSMQ